MGMSGQRSLLLTEQRYVFASIAAAAQVQQNSKNLSDAEEFVLMSTGLKNLILLDMTFLISILRKTGLSHEGMKIQPQEKMIRPAGAEVLQYSLKGK